jgi:hypothetical protein
VSTNGSAVLVDSIRQAYAEAEAEGRDRPGRPALVKMLAAPPEITPWQVRKAKELVDAELASPPPVDASPTPASPALADPARQSASRPLVLWPQDTPQRLAAANEQLAAAIEAATPPAPTSPPPSKAARPWPLVFIGMAAAVAVWSGWVGLGEMTGFGTMNLLPGIGGGFTLNTAIVLPLSVEAYAAYALRVWLSTSYHSDRTIRFARRSTWISLTVGGAAQVAYHLLAAAGYTKAPWVVTMLVPLVPVLVLGVASALAKLVHVDRQGGEQA